MVTGAERSQLEEALERLHVIERRVEVMQVRQEHGQAAVAAIRGKPKASRTATETLLLALALDEPVLTPSTPEEPVEVDDA